MATPPSKKAQHFCCWFIDVRLWLKIFYILELFYIFNVSIFSAKIINKNNELLRIIVQNLSERMQKIR